MNHTPRYETSKRVTFVNAGTNVFLAFFKIIAGYWGHSHALVADGVHSLSDLISDALVLIAAKIGGKMPDKEHPYGHQRIETIAAMIIAILLWVVGGSIIYETYNHIAQGKSAIIEGPAVILAAVVSMIAKEILYRYTLAAGKKVNSNLLITNAYHNRSDVWVSALVLISVITALSGFRYADNIGAGIIALLIVKAGFQLFFQGLRELIDTGADEETLAQIRDCIQQTSGVVSIHQLRTRSHGGNIFVDTHIIVNPFISVSEGHHVGETVHRRLSQAFPKIADVIVHIDPENDEINKPCIHLSSRSELLQQLKERCAHLPGFSQIENIQLHYMDGRLYIHFYWPKTALPPDQWAKAAEMYQKEVRELPNIADVHLFLRLE